MNTSTYNALTAPAIDLPSASTVKPDQKNKGVAADEQAYATARKFEALLLHTMLKHMRAAGTESTLLNSDSVDLYKDMFDQQISKEISSNGSFGLAEVIYRQLTADTANKPGDKSIRRADAMLPTLYNNPNTQTLTAINTVHEHSSPTDKGTPQQFVQRIGKYAKGVANKLGTSAEAVIAIAALETGWGKRIPLNPDGSSTNNLFGIKADSNWNGRQTIARTSEFRAGLPTTELASFRSYKNEKQSVEDFANFLTSNPRYKQALHNAADNENFLHELQQAGYATDPQYANKVTAILNQLTIDPKL